LRTRVVTYLWYLNDVDEGGEEEGEENLEYEEEHTEVDQLDMQHVDILEDKIITLEEELSQKTVLIEQLQDEIQATSLREKNTYQHEIHSLEDQVDKHEETIRTLKREIFLAQTEIASVVKENTEALDTEKRKHSMVKADLLQQISTFKTTLKSQQENSENLRNEMKTIQESKREDGNSETDLGKVSEEYEAKYKVLNNEIERLKALLPNKEEQNEGSEIELQNTSIPTINGTDNNSINENDVLEIEKYKNLLQEKKAECENLRDQLDAHKSLISSKNEQLKGVRIVELQKKECEEEILKIKAEIKEQAENYKTVVNAYRASLLSSYQNQLNNNVETVLKKIIQLRTKT